MIKAAKFSGFLGLGLAVALSLGGCSSAPQGDSYVPPGLELGETVVNPPKELPAPAVQPDNASEVKVDISCEAPQQLSQEIVSRLNAPETTVERKDPSLDGDFILSASELPIESSYQKVFSYLVKATMASGKTIWLGANGSLTDPEVLEKVILNPEGASSIFGATPEAYKTLVWGAKAGPQGALVQESTKVVEQYEVCF